MRLRAVECGALGVVLLWALVSPAWSAQQSATPKKPAAAQKQPAQKQATTKKPAAEQKQAETPPTDTVPPTDTAPKVIAVTDVIPSSELALTQLRDIRTALEADTSIGVVETGLPAFSEQLNQWWQGEAATIRQLRSMQRMNDILWQLRLYEGQIETWNALLTASSKMWSEEKEAMGALLAIWKETQLTLDSAAPEDVGKKIAEVLSEGDGVQQLFQDKTAHLVTIQSGLAASLKRVIEIRVQVDAVNLQPSENLMTFTSPPMWKALFTEEATRSTSAQISEGFTKLYKDVVRFFELYKDRLVLHGVLFLALVALFLRLRHLSRQPSEVTPTDAEKFILDRSFASAMLVGAFLVLLIYSDASPQMMRMILFPAVVPLLILLPAIFNRRIRRPIYLLTAVYALDFLRYYLPPQWIQVRILLLVEAVMGIGVIYLLQRARLFESEKLKSRETLVRALLKIGIGLFVCAIIANILGALNLAEILFSPLVRILYIGVVIRMMTVVFTTFAMMSLRSPIALMLRTVQENGDAVAENIRRVTNFIAAGMWIIGSLFNIGIFGILVNAVEKAFDAKLNLGAIGISVREVVMFVLVFGIAYALSRMMRFILAKEIFPRFQMPRGVPDVLELMARYGVLLFGFLLALVSAGVNLSQMTIALSAFGVGIGFGLQNIVNNFVCGLILVFEHPIQVGDIVEVGTHSGQVERIGFRSSSVSTGDGCTVIIPNSELIGSKVLNWSLSDQLRRVTLRVPVPIDTDPNQVIEILRAAAHNQPDTVDDPAPSAALDRFGDGSLVFILRCWTQISKHESVTQCLTLAISKAFQEAGIQIPITQSEVHLRLPNNVAAEFPGLEKLK